MAPPPAYPPEDWAWLLAKTTCVRLTLAPSLSRPPPKAGPAGTDARPLAIVRASMAKSVEPLAWKTRVAFSPLTVILLAPGPLILRSRSEERRVGKGRKRRMGLGD